jgi:solute carrier family 66, member 2
VLELLIAPFDSLYPTYWGLLGAVGLTVEATLPIPQLLSNSKSQSCRGFRLSLLVSWLLGDALKMYWFFTSTTSIPWAFKICGMFQAACDCGLGIQYLMYGEGAPSSTAQQWPYSGVKPHLPREASGRSTPTGRKTPLSEKHY